MISDTLHSAVLEIDRYLGDPTFDTVYEGDVREEIVELRNAMNAMRERLDAFPTDLGKAK